MPDTFEEQRAEQRDARSGESEYRYGDELVVERADAEQSGHGRPEQHPRGVRLLGGQVQTGCAQYVRRLVGSLGRLAQEHQADSQRQADSGEHERPTPVVGLLRDPADEQDPRGLCERVVQAAPREHTGPGMGRVCVSQIGVVDGVGRAVADSGDQVQEGEGPHVADEPHERHDDREDREADRGHDLATPTVGDDGLGQSPHDLGDGGYERERSESRVAQAERPLDVRPENTDAVLDHVGDERRESEQDQRRVSEFAKHPQERGRLAFTGSRDQLETRDRLRVSAAADGFSEQLIGNDEVEDRSFSHGRPRYP